LSHYSMPPSFGPLLNGESSVLHAALGRVGGDLQGTCRWNRRCRRRALGPALVDALVDPGGDSEGNPGRRSSNPGTSLHWGIGRALRYLKMHSKDTAGTVALDQLLGDEVRFTRGQCARTAAREWIGITVDALGVALGASPDFSSVSTERCTGGSRRENGRGATSSRVRRRVASYGDQ
jgi:hypothetical protein